MTLLLYRAEVIKKIDRTKTIELRTDIFNQHKQKVTSGFSKVKVVEKLKPLIEKEDKI